VPVVADVSWEARFLALLPLVERIIDFVAHRHRLSQADADDFASDVKVKLIQDNYAVLRKFEGRSSMRTFLTMVVVNALQDHQNAEWGKYRPSAEARRSGPDAMILERLLVRDSLSFDDAVQVATASFGVTRTRPDLERMAARFPTRFRRRFEDDDILTRLPGSQRPDASLLAHERETMWHHVAAILHALKDELDSQDALILALRFEDGLKVAAIATILGLPARPLYDRVYLLLRRLRLALEAHGVDASLVRELVEEDGV
jgi:RNA polymerase sigma factor (sigma-70 family)